MLVRWPLKTHAVICAGFLLLIPITAVSQAKPVDRTTVSNGKSLHFRILEGRKDDVFFFESGGGNDPMLEVGGIAQSDSRLSQMVLDLAINHAELAQQPLYNSTSREGPNVWRLALQNQPPEGTRPLRRRYVTRLP